jgi:hypothetical protein
VAGIVPWCPLVLALFFACGASFGCDYDTGSEELDATGTGDAEVDGELHADVPNERPDAAPASPDAAREAGDAPAAPLPACANGLDDDCDGLVDYAGGDPGCSGPDDDNENAPGLVCDDGLDNDFDNLIDYAVPGCGREGDPGCDSPTDPVERDTLGPP